MIKLFIIAFIAYYLTVSFIDYKHERKYKTKSSALYGDSCFK